MLPIVLNPYELHARSPCASAVLLIAQPAITLLPSPLEGLDAQHIAQAMLDSPAFERLMDKWSWAGHLWRSGSLSAGVAGVTPIAWVQQAAADIAADPGAPGRAGQPARTLAKLVGATRFEQTPRYLDAVCKDLERGGGDPAVSVPINVGLERYAANLAAPVAASPTDSVVSRLERRRERPLLRLTTTIVHGASGLLLAELRDALDDELADFRHAVAESLHARSPAASDSVIAAADRLERAVNAIPDGVLGPRDDDELRVRGGVRRLPVSFTIGIDNHGGALSAAQQAAAIVAGPRRPPAARSTKAGTRRAASTPADPNAPKPASTALAHRPVLRLTVKPLPFTAA